MQRVTPISTNGLSQLRFHPSKGFFWIAFSLPTPNLAMSAKLLEPHQ
jgi:hypothetical protein